MKRLEWQSSTFKRLTMTERSVSISVSMYFMLNFNKEKFQMVSFVFHAVHPVI